MKVSNENPFIDVKNDQMLVRYMSSDFLLSQLNRKSLFFKKASKFYDTSEFETPIKDREFKAKMYGADTLKYADEGYESLKEICLISCWSIADENETLWERFCNNKNGIIIVSRRDKLINSLKDCGYRLDKGKVRYLNFNEDIFYSEDYPITVDLVTSAIFHKQIGKEFEIEKEFRLLIDLGVEENINFWTQEEKNELGRYIKVDFNQMVDKIIFHPEMKKARKNELKVYCKSMNFSFEFVDSIFEIGAF